jgi:ribosomal protein S18 acetylase RimI-like enzyme
VRGPEPIIRRAGARDEAAAWAIANEYFASSPIIIPDDATTFQTYLEDPNRFWIVEHSAQVVGCVAFRPLPDVPRAGEVRRLYVRPTHRGAGLADALMTVLETSARNEGFETLYLDTHETFAGAIALYERRGYERIPRYNKNPLATIFMRRDL